MRICNLFYSYIFFNGNKSLVFLIKILAMKPVMTDLILTVTSITD